MSMNVQIPESKVHAEITDPGRGEHLWMFMVCFRVSDESIKALNRGEDPGPQMLDHESVLTLQGLGCCKCEQQYSKRIALRKCTGSME